MVRLDKLNRICAKRLVARTIPSHIACRLLGNEERPCVLDKICLPVEKKGLWYFYSILLLACLSTFLAAFWVLRITRVGRLLSFFLRLLIPPIRWVCRVIMGIKAFFDGLPW